MTENNLQATARTTDGKGPARQIRFKDRVPGIFYFRNEINVPISVDSRELLKLIKSKPALINLNVEGSDTLECVIRDIQRDPLTDSILHFDLMGIKRGQKLTVTVSLKFIGEASGVRTEGGILQTSMNEVEVECLPKDIPSFIEVEVSDLDIGQSRFIRDLDLKDIKLLYEPDEVIASVVPPSVTKEVVEEVDLEEEEGVEEDGEKKDGEKKEDTVSKE